MQIIRPTGIIEGGHGQRWWASLELSDQGQESQSRHPQSARCMLLAWFAKLNTGALGMTGRDARGHRGAGLKTAATTAKRRGRSCGEGNFAACSEAGDASDANHS